MAELNTFYKVRYGNEMTADNRWNPRLLSDLFATIMTQQVFVHVEDINLTSCLLDGLTIA